jgi:CrcB protein
MHNFLFVCLGGALGSGARYLVGLWAENALGRGFPFGTLMVNTAGCFFLSFIMALFLSSGSLSPATRLFLTTGLMGGLTTYSTFNHETLKLVESGSTGTALLYVAATLVACILCGLLGLMAGSRLASLVG